MAPRGTAMTGIEMDPVTAAVAAALHPQAQVLCGNFADTRGRKGRSTRRSATSRSAPPPARPRYNPNPARGPDPHPLHPQVSRADPPGGLIALITSRLDHGRHRGDAVAARRAWPAWRTGSPRSGCPATAHRRTAGTTVVTDVLVFRRLRTTASSRPRRARLGADRPGDVDGSRPDQPALRQQPRHGARRTRPRRRPPRRRPAGPRATRAPSPPPPSPPRSPRPPPPAPPAAPAGTGPGRPLQRPAARPPRSLPARGLDQPPEGYQRACPDGSFERIVGHFYEKFDPPGKPADHEELRALLGLRDTALSLLDAELATSEDAGPVDALRAELNPRYDAYAAAYGPVNRYTPQIRLRATPEGRALREEMLADGRAELTGGTFEVTDPAAGEALVAYGYAEPDGDGRLKHKQTKQRPAPPGST